MEEACVFCYLRAVSGEMKVEEKARTKVCSKGCLSISCGSRQREMLSTDHTPWVK